jgi:hypothetical protein
MSRVHPVNNCRGEGGVAMQMRIRAAAATAETSDLERSKGSDTSQSPGDKDVGCASAPWSRNTNIIKDKVWNTTCCTTMFLITEALILMLSPYIEMGVSQYNPAWVPEPPVTYAEALRRQQVDLIISTFYNM